VVYIKKTEELTTIAFKNSHSTREKRKQGKTTGKKKKQGGV
jgi:hypothetical protein